MVISFLLIYKEVIIISLIRDEPYIELQIAVNEQALRDLACLKSMDSAILLTRYLLTHYIDSEEKMKKLVTLALVRRFGVLLKKIAIDIDKMEVKIQRMKMTLDDLFNDMEATAKNIEKLASEELDNVYTSNEADKIEETLSDEIESESENEDESEDEDTTNNNENMEDK